MQLSGDEDLTLGDVSGQVRNGVGDVVAGHGQDGELGDGSLLALDDPCSLVLAGQVGVHVTWVATSSGHLFTSSTHLSERLAIVGHVGVDDEHVHVQIECQVLGGGQPQPGGENPLHSRVIGQVEENDCSLQSASSLEVSQEVLSLFVGDAHGAEDNCEGLGLTKGLGLPGDLQSKIVVRQTSAREDGQLLAAHQGICAIDS